MIKITEEVYWTHVEPLDLSFIQVSFFPQWFYIYLAFQAKVHCMAYELLFAQQVPK